ncbi:MAG TPA: hypothetical protein VFH45_03725, partial [Acidimicrobiales bacterium]|nr:hypothetical protein [Acidimicrobiales bacterium]
AAQSQPGDAQPGAEPAEGPAVEAQAAAAEPEPAPAAASAPEAAQDAATTAVPEGTATGSEE